VSPASGPRTRTFVLSLAVTAMLMGSSSPALAAGKKAPPPPECPVVAALVASPLGPVIVVVAGLPVVGPIVGAICI